MNRVIGCFFTLLIVCQVEAAGWLDAAHRKTISNGSVEATFQSGMLCSLKDTKTGEQLISVSPESMSTDLPLFSGVRFDLGNCDVKSGDAGKDAVDVTLAAKDGTEWTLRWGFESGDLVFKSNAKTPSPVDEFRILLPGCDIKRHAMVWIHAYGVGHTANAPWEGIFLGDPSIDGSPMAFPHPLVALFQGEKSGWFIEGRDERIGPACLMVKGKGDSVSLGMVRRFIEPTSSPSMYEIRIRTYSNHWEDAVDPYVKWMEEGAGFVSLDKLPEKQAWIGKLKTQAYPGFGDFKALDELAKRVNPAETFIGRQGELRAHGFDIGYPDYRLTDDAKKWVKHARDLGFHVGMHFNCKSVSVMFPELIERFRPGCAVIGRDDAGKDIYETIYQGPNMLYRVSAAFKPWRDYLIDQMKDAVDSGIDVIYLDEAMSPGGKMVVDGVDGYQGLLLLMKEVQERYPHVGVETEQFNTLTGKFGKLALSQMPLGHPLSGYIFRKYIKVVPEGLMYSPTEIQMMDAFDSWGFMLPGASTVIEESWMQIAEAFHRYQLVPDSRLPRKQVTRFVDHWTHGAVPAESGPIDEAGEKVFGFRGADGVTAFLERTPTRRGLVIYQPGQEAKWVGTRHTGIKSHEGPGVPAYFGYREYLRDWLIYDDTKILGLDPAQSYWFDASVSRSPTRFHVFKVPDDFAGVSTMEVRSAPQESAKDDAYFILRMAGKGEIGVHVPDDYDAYLNGRKLTVDPGTKQAFALIDASKTGTPGLGYHIELNPDQDKAKAAEQAGPAVLLAVRKTSTDLIGGWAKLKWYGSVDSLKWIKTDAAGNFTMNVGAVGRLVGRIPDAANVRMQGAFQIREQTVGSPGDGVIRINGVEVLRIPHGKPPFPRIPFDVDISSYAGRHVLIEFTSDGPVRGATAEWIDPRITSTR